MKRLLVLAVLAATVLGTAAVAEPVSGSSCRLPSDLEQMPHLLNFLRDNGSLLSNEHMPLIAHTANDIVTSLTGVYPDQHGLNVANNYGYFNSDGSISFPSDFTYWTDPVQTSHTPSPTTT